MASTTIPAEVFPPGELLRDELADRGWAEGEFAEIIARPAQAVSEILNGKKEITPETAVAIAAALGTTAELWLNLQAAYRLHQVRSTKDPALKPVERRARLRSLVPVRELQKRSWLPSGNDLDRLEQAVCELLAIGDLGDEPQLEVAARRSNPGVKFTPEQTAWIARVERLGKGRVSVPFDRASLAKLGSSLVHQLQSPQDLTKVPDLLAECGVALVIELPLRNSKMDGVVSFWTDTPIIGLSTRGNRMDGFVFTLLHEMAHLTLGHITSGELGIDEGIDPKDRSDREGEANDAAARWMFPNPPDVPGGELTPSMLLRMARDCGVHPAFLIGRLQHEGRLEWKNFRRIIPQVRPFVPLG